MNSTLSSKTKPEPKIQQTQDIRQSVTDLEAMLKRHRQLMEHYMGEGFLVEGDFPSYKMRYKAMLKTTIEELEKTRRSFKSRQVEGLRLRLIQELVDIE